MVKKFFKKLKTEHYILAFIMLITILLRFPQLGYSHFYGDETKTLYWDKRIPAKEFLLTQRKGPVQFFVVWIVETVTGGFDELAVRLPFAVAGSVAVLVFYLILKSWFNKRVGYIGAFLYAVNGFFIAFSRTAQYQSFLWLFGLLAILFAEYSVKKKDHKKLHLILSGVFLGLGFLSHYDAIFYVVPITYVLGKTWFVKDKLKIDKDHLIYLGIPLLLLVSAFYIPYIVGGYFKIETLGYLNRRFDGIQIIPTSLETFMAYNPSLFNYVILAFAPLFLFSRYRSKAVVLDLWFTAPMILFEIVFSKPGTHIQNYIIPMFAMTGLGLDLVIDKLWKSWTKFILGGVLVVALWGITANAFKIYIPLFNAGHPWNKQNVDEADHKLHLYGFPYNRGWKEIGKYLKEVGAHTFYTSDNLTIGEYYSLGIYSERVGAEYFVHVFENQEFRNLRDVTKDFFWYKNYELVKEVFVNGKKTAEIYKQPQN